MAVWTEYSPWAQPESCSANFNCEGKKNSTSAGVCCGQLGLDVPQHISSRHNTSTGDRATVTLMDRSRRDTTT